VDKTRYPHKYNEYCEDYKTFGGFWRVLSAFAHVRKAFSQFTPREYGFRASTPSSVSQNLSAGHKQHGMPPNLFSIISTVQQSRQFVRLDAHCLNMSPHSTVPASAPFIASNKGFVASQNSVAGQK